MRRSLVILVIAVGLAASGCGGGDDNSSGQASTGAQSRSTSTTAPSGRAGATGSAGTKAKDGGGPPASNPGPENAGAGSGKFPGVYAETFRICSQGPIARVAANVGVKTTDPRKIARAMAHGYLLRYRSDALRGCTRGLKVAAALK